MKLFFLFAFTLFILSSVDGQNNTSKAVISKWSNAIVNIEVKGYNKNYPMQQKLDSIGKLIQKGIIPKEKYPDYLSYFIVESYIPQTSSGIFLKYKNHYFIITARHVLYNKDAYGEQKSFNGIGYEDGEYNTYTEMYYVPRPTEDTSSMIEVPQIFIHPYNISNYVFSDSATDLAIVLLEDSIGNVANPFSLVKTFITSSL